MELFEKNTINIVRENQRLIQPVAQWQVFKTFFCLIDKLHFYYAAGMLCLICFGSPSLAGAHFHPLNDITETAERFIEKQTQIQNHQRLTVKTRPLSPHLRLNTCSQPLSASIHPSQTNSRYKSVQIRCLGPKPWSLYVPVQVKLLAPVVIARRQIASHAVIEPDDIILSEKDISQLHYGFYPNKNALLHYSTKMTIAQGTVISPNMIKLPLLVKRHEQVKIISQNSALMIRMSGKALMDGIKHQKIQVINNNSGKMIEAIVTGLGQVTVGNINRK